jgi:predicted transcriptional regulator of viral defense system
METKRARGDRFSRAIKVFKKHGGVLRTTEATNAGIHPATLYSLRDAGVLERLSRGVYRLAENPPLSNPDLITVASRLPNAVICLISALSFHDITTQIPHEVHVALKHGAEEPRLDFPPIRTYRFTGKAFTEGVEIHELDAVRLRIYSPEKTLADVFKFRNKIGMDTAIEALRLYRERREVKIDSILHFASLCRVADVMKPYLESVLT